MFWQRLDAPGVEYFRLRPIPEGWKLRGAVVLYLDPDPFFIQYSLITDANWKTCSLLVESEFGDAQRQLHLSRDANGAWSRESAPAPELKGCLVPDLMFSPSANLLPFRQLDLKVGETGEWMTAWVSLPELLVLPMKQRVTRVSENRYRSETSASASTREIDVDEFGLPLRYSTLWKAIP